DPTITEAVRQQALSWTEPFWRIHVHAEAAKNALALNDASWSVVGTRDADPAAYERALRQIHTAYRLAPDNLDFLNLLGVACYRVGKYDEALEALGRCNKLRKESVPGDLAFLAMTQHQLGQKEQARTTLERLREIVKKWEWTNNVEAQGFLREAEEV